MASEPLEAASAVASSGNLAIKLGVLGARARERASACRRLDGRSAWPWPALTDTSWSRRKTTQKIWPWQQYTSVAKVAQTTGAPCSTRTALAPVNGAGRRVAVGDAPAEGVKLSTLPKIAGALGVRLPDLLA
jgi:hypothetical protein